MTRFIVALAAALALSGSAWGHGINGHVHVTGWAIERLPPGDIADFFADPALFEVALFAASFPDSGYAVDDPYGEMAHWPPFLEAFIGHVLVEAGPPPYETDDARRLAAFAIGLACHGLQDEIFDSIFLHHIREHDGEGQDAADPGTDAMLHTDGYLRWRPAQWAPLDDLVRVFADEGYAVEPETIEAGMLRVKFLVIDNFHNLAPTLDRRYRPLLPWTARHYVDPAVPGSLAAEIPATGAFIEALWQRLHGRAPMAGIVGHPYPDGRRRLMSRDPASAGSWVTLVLGIGARVGSVTADRVHLEGPTGPVPFDLHHTRWGGGRDDWTRIIQLRPQVELAADTVYTVRVDPGLEYIDGRVLEVPWQYVFQTPCADEGDSDMGAPCPSEPADGGISPVDAALPDVALPDAALPDATPRDTALPDAAPIDGGVSDAGVERDAGARRDAAPPASDAGSGAAAEPDGCASAVPTGHERAWLAGLIGLVLLIGLGRRSGRRGAPAERR